MDLNFTKSLRIRQGSIVDDFARYCNRLGRSGDIIRERKVFLTLNAPNPEFSVPTKTLNLLADVIDVV